MNLALSNVPGVVVPKTVKYTWEPGVKAANCAGVNGFQLRSYALTFVQTATYVGVGLGDGVAVAQTHVALFTQSGFLQSPLLQIKPVRQLLSKEQPLPHCGTGLGDGVMVGAIVGLGLGLGVGDGVGQRQFTLFTQSGFLQAPLLQIWPLRQLLSNEQLLPHCGTGEGVGVGNGLGLGVGIGLGDGLGVGTGDGVTSEKFRLQLKGATVGATVAAAGLLDGALGVIVPVLV
jgi:hypothetical protein